jgi:hypothetical protein
MNIGFESPDVVILSHPRSGTHLLHSALSSHPKIHGRGECVLRYGRRNEEVQTEFPPIWVRTFRNSPGHINVAIVMYAMVALFEELCGRLKDHKLIHLIRDPDRVATSLAQLEADKIVLGSNYKSHYRMNETLPPSANISPMKIQRIAAKVAADQRLYVLALASHQNCLTITYEALTRNQEVSTIPAPISIKVLTFLGLDFFELTTTLRKTGH